MVYIIYIGMKLADGLGGVSHDLPIAATYTVHGNEIYVSMDTFYVCLHVHTYYCINKIVKKTHVL